MMRALILTVCAGLAAVCGVTGSAQAQDEYVVVLLDESESMGGFTASGRMKLDEAQDTFRDVIARSLIGADGFAFATFSGTSVNIRIPFSDRHPRRVFEEEIYEHMRTDLSPNGETPLADAFCTLVDQAIDFALLSGSTPETATIRVELITDGIETSSVETSECSGYFGRPVDGTETGFQVGSWQSFMILKAMTGRADGEVALSRWPASPVVSNVTMLFDRALSTSYPTTGGDFNGPPFQAQPLPGLTEPRRPAASLTEWIEERVPTTPREHEALRTIEGYGVHSFQERFGVAADVGGQYVPPALERPYYNELNFFQRAEMYSYMALKQESQMIEAYGALASATGGTVTVVE